jgi:dephospho-CoA kinase
VVLDIPLLFEKWRATAPVAPADVTVTVSAPLWMQRKRVLARKGMSDMRLRQIRRLQVPDHVKRARADFVIETGCQKTETHGAVRRLIACLHARKGR